MTLPLKCNGCLQKKRNLHHQNSLMRHLCPCKNFEACGASWFGKNNPSYLHYNKTKRTIKVESTSGRKCNYIDRHVCLLCNANNKVIDAEGLSKLRTVFSQLNACGDVYFKPGKVDLASHAVVFRRVVFHEIRLS